MKKVKNLTESKGLINTFRKLKTKSHLNKSNLKKNNFYYAKFCKKNFFKKQPQSKSVFVNVFLHKFNANKTISNLPIYKQSQLFKLNLMFIN